jgi:ribosomal protein L11 methyltransferase
VPGERHKMRTIWYQIDILCSDAEEDLWPLLESGAKGGEVLAKDLLRCFVPSEALAPFQVQVNELGFSIKSSSEVEDKAWVQEWPEIWKPVAVGRVSIVPVREVEGVDRAAPADPASSTSPITIRIIPGLGFGTGHHTSTQLAIELLQSPELSASTTLSAKDRALDLGTGSGVLALAIEALFPCPIDAIDNDPDAIDNAITNLQLNSSSRITTSVGVLGAVQERYQLIAANLYAELLSEIEPTIRAACATNGYLVLAGIMEGKESLIDSSFSTKHWKLIHRRTEPGWYAFLFQRRGDQ